MPTYDYECRECGHEFEHFQAMSEDPLSTCPQCGGRLRRLIGGGTGVIFKGSGFYVTDNGQKKGAEAAGSSGDEKKGDSGASSQKDGKNGQKKESPKGGASGKEAKVEA